MNIKEEKYAEFRQIKNDCLLKMNHNHGLFQDLAPMLDMLFPCSSQEKKRDEFMWWVNNWAKETWTKGPRSLS